MNIERIDHVHIKCSDFDPSVQALEGILGREFMLKQDMSEDQGTIVAYEPYPIGLEVMKGTADVGSGVFTNAAPEGVFTISLKVADITEATTEMESLGFPAVWRGDFGPIQEVLFDTKKSIGFMIELIQYKGNNILEAYQGE